jgi:hypothetical protein
MRSDPALRTHISHPSPPLTPLVAPAVLNNPVVGAFVGAVPHQQHSMVQLPPALGVQDTALVEGEGEGGVHSDGKGPCPRQLGRDFLLVCADAPPACDGGRFPSPCCLLTELLGALSTRCRSVTIQIAMIAAQGLVVASWHAGRTAAGLADRKAG